MGDRTRKLTCYSFSFPLTFAFSYLILYVQNALTPERTVCQNFRTDLPFIALIMRSNPRVIGGTFQSREPPLEDERFALRDEIRIFVSIKC